MIRFMLPFLLAGCGPRLISGQVLDVRGNPVDHAIVSLEPGQVEILTDVDGRYVIDYMRADGERTKLEPRTLYTLEVFKPGYETVRENVPYKSGEHVLQPIALVQDVLRVQDDGENLVPTLGEDRTTSGGSTYEGQ